MIQYSPRSARAISVLFRKYNSCDIFIEDSSLVSVHERLINIALEGKGRVDKVIPIGGREQVIAAANDDTNPDGRPRLYVVDGDLEAIYRRNPRRIRNLYTLKVYEVENILLDDKQIEDWIVTCFPKVSRDQALNAVDLPGFWTELNSIESYLFALAVAHKVNLQHAANRIDPNSIARLDGNFPIGIDEVRLRGRVFEIFRALAQTLGRANLRIEVTRLRDLHPNGIDIRKSAPGKKVLLHFLKGRISACAGNTLPHGTVCGILALTPNFSAEPSYRRRLRRLL